MVTMKSGTSMTSKRRRELKPARELTDDQLMASAYRSLPCLVCHQPVRPKQPFIVQLLDGHQVKLHSSCTK